MDGDWLLVNNGFTIQYTPASFVGGSTTWTFPTAFTTNRYCMLPFVWIDGIGGPDVIKTVTSCSWNPISRNNWPAGGITVIGY